jgi:hypothetical protein
MNTIASNSQEPRLSHASASQAYIPLAGTAFAFFAMTLAGLIGAANVAMSMVM